MSKHLSNIQITFSLTKLNAWLDRPAIAEVTQVHLIHYGIDNWLFWVNYIIIILCFVPSWQKEHCKVAGMKQHDKTDSNIYIWSISKLRQN